MTPRRGYRAADVRAAEQPLLDAGEPLMRRAAAALAAELRDLSPDRMLVLVGAGSNGGDALYAAAELAAEGCTVDLVATAERHHPEASAAAEAAGARWADATEAGDLATRADLILDGITGTGTGTGTGADASPALRGAAREIVARVLPVVTGTPRPVVVAVDLPSGIGPDDGSVPDPTVLPADVTVTFGAEKAGLLRDPGSRYAGRVVLVDLGLDPYLPSAPAVTVE